MKTIIKQNTPDFLHQIEATSFIEKKDFVALFMEQGTGKSKTILNKITQLYEEDSITAVTIVCPTQIKYQWLCDVLQKFFIYDYAYFIYDNKKTIKFKKEFIDFLNSPKIKFFIVNIEAFQGRNLKTVKDKNLFEQVKKLSIFYYIDKLYTKEKVFTIIDESTIISNHKASRTRVVLEFFKNQKYKAILTGTPITKSATNLYSQFEFLKKSFWGMDYYAFERAYVIKYSIRDAFNKQRSVPITEKQWSYVKNCLNSIKKIRSLTFNDFEDISLKAKMLASDIMYINNQAEFSPFKNLEQIKDKIKPFSFICKKDDCLDLPEKIYENIYCDLTKEQIRLIKELKHDWLTTYKDSMLTINHHIALQNKLSFIRSGFVPSSQVKNDSKYLELEENPAFKCLLDDLNFVTNERVIIWANYRVELLKIVDGIPFDNKVLLFGDTHKDERIRIETEFKKGNIQVLVMNPVLGALGLNLQNCNLHYFFSNDPRYYFRVQAEDRSHRIGLKNNVVYKTVVVRKSIDEKILAAHKLKKDLSDYITDIKEFF